MKSVIGTLFKGSVFIVWSVVMLYVVSLLTLRLIGYETTIVMSDSMSPLLRTGDVVVIRRLDEYQVGDVIQFRRGDIYYLHRIVSETPTGYLTQGDANPIPDRMEVQKFQIHGTAIGVLRKLGNPLFQFRRLVDGVSHAAFKSQTSISSSAHSRYWLNPSMSWIVTSGSGSVSFTSPNSVIFTNNGIRSIQSSITNSATVKIYLDGRITQRDNTVGGFHFSTHTCLDILSRPTCGWVVYFDDISKMVKLYSYQSNGTFSPLLASKSYSMSLTQNRKYVLEMSGSRILVKIDNEVVLDVANPKVLATENFGRIPNGTRILMYVQANNRFTANKLVIW